MVRLHDVVVWGLAALAVLTAVTVLRLYNAILAASSNAASSSTRTSPSVPSIGDSCGFGTADIGLACRLAPSPLGRAAGGGRLQCCCASPRPPDSTDSTAPRTPPPPRCLPQVFILGAPKAGTTVLFAHLARHPLFAAPRRKEGHYFDGLPASLFPARLPHDDDDDDGGGGGGGRAASLFARYLAMFPPSHDPSKAFTGEASPSYLASSTAPQLLRRFYEGPSAPLLGRRVPPSASAAPLTSSSSSSLHLPQFIVILRDPTDRALSELRMQNRRILSDQIFWRRLSLASEEEGGALGGGALDGAIGGGALDGLAACLGLTPRPTRQPQQSQQPQSSQQLPRRRAWPSISCRQLWECLPEEARDAGLAPGMFLGVVNTTLDTGTSTTFYQDTAFHLNLETSRTSRREDVGGGGEGHGGGHEDGGGGRVGGGEECRDMHVRWRVNAPLWQCVQSHIDADAATPEPGGSRRGNTARCFLDAWSHLMPPPTPLGAEPTLRAEIARLDACFNGHPPHTPPEDLPCYPASVNDDLSGPPHHFAFRGLYASHLSTWFRYFSPDRFLVLSDTELRRDASRTMDRVHSFLGLQPPPTAADSLLSGDALARFIERRFPEMEGAGWQIQGRGRGGGQGGDGGARGGKRGGNGGGGGEGGEGGEGQGNGGGHGGGSGERGESAARQLLDVFFRPHNVRLKGMLQGMSLRAGNDTVGDPARMEDTVNELSTFPWL